MSFDFRFLTAGESAVVVEFGNTIDENINARVHLLASYCKSAAAPLGIVELTPTYRSLLIIFDPAVTARKNIINAIEKYFSENGHAFENAVLPETAKTVEIPVLYGGEYGPDIETVAKYNDISKDEVIKIHCAATYKVYMLGFLPGFPYLGGMDEKIACPRLEIPRTIVPAGSVGIAGGQTGVYPVDSPGGWQLIGKTPLAIFDVCRERPFLLKPGDSIVFKPIDRETFAAISSIKAVRA